MVCEVTVSLREDLIALRAAIKGGSDWLAAMRAIAGSTPGSKRFVAMHHAMMEAGPNRRQAHSLTNFFLKKDADFIVAFINGVIAALPEVDLQFPTWPTLGLPNRRAA